MSPTAFKVSQLRETERHNREDEDVRRKGTWANLVGSLGSSLVKGAATVAGGALKVK